MPTATPTARRTEHLLALMTKGDDLFNARDWGALEVVHHPDMIAHIPGSAEPIYGREAHGAAVRGKRSRRSRPSSPYTTSKENRFVPRPATLCRRARKSRTRS